MVGHTRHLAEKRNRVGATVILTGRERSLHFTAEENLCLVGEYNAEKTVLFSSFNELYGNVKHHSLGEKPPRIDPSVIPGLVTG